jgi:prepilin-type N-terminal cleavage/methylation domain-containing protein
MRRDRQRSSSGVSASHRSAFTMVELLVVMAIIALMVAVLMPALSKAKEASRRARCAANLRQWGLMIHNYAVDNKSNTPGVVWWGNIDTFGLNIDADGGGPLPAVQGSTLEIPKYGIRQGVTQCPSRTSKRNTPTGIVAANAEMDYWMFFARGDYPTVAAQAGTGHLWSPRVINLDKRMPLATLLMMDRHFWKFPVHSRRANDNPGRNMVTAISNHANGEGYNFPGEAIPYMGFADGANALRIDGAVQWHNLNGTPNLYTNDYYWYMAVEKGKYP